MLVPILYVHCLAWLGLAWLGLNHFFHLLQTQRFDLIKILQLFFWFSSATAMFRFNVQ